MKRQTRNPLVYVLPTGATDGHALVPTPSPMTEERRTRFASRAGFASAKKKKKRKSGFFFPNFFRDAEISGRDGTARCQSVALQSSL